jgi:dihydroorotate dehydrogenase electron transfer subunit
MKKQIADWLIKENRKLTDQHTLLKLTLADEMPEILPGQFVQVAVKNAPDVFLRRPISVHWVGKQAHELWLLIQSVGAGTRRLAQAATGDTLNLIFPLGNTFSIPAGGRNARLLLIGGGVGVAPLLYLGAFLKERGFQPVFLLGARTENDLLQLDEFRKYGEVCITTENGILGEKGFVTNHSILQQKADFIYSCGPKPMMIAVARYARQQSIPCEVSLENSMACGIGACLCCVEKTTKGNTCVCTEGPIFNIDQLTWQI